tara:strand:+ start:29 stop:238 length:210 start_codon:yes stop_codon:yes gene_type:complete
LGEVRTMKPTDEDLMIGITSDIMVNMGVAMIQQDLPDDTEMLGITLGEFKKMAQITEKEIKVLKRGIEK